MSMPEFVIQHGANLAWKFLRENTYVLGHFLKELPVERQEEYKRLIETEDVAIFLGFPVATSRLPLFAISLKGESEDPRGGQFVGDIGPSTSPLPFPGEDNEANWEAYEGLPPVRPDIPPEEFQGVVYSSENEGPQYYNVDGDRTKGEVRLFSPRKKNLWQQRELGMDSDDQYERMSHTQKLWNKDTHLLLSGVHGDRCSIEIQVITDNSEKTMIYYRLLRWVLRRFKTWLYVNGFVDPVFSGGDMTPMPEIQTTSGTPPFKRSLFVNFLHYDFAFEVEPVLAGFLIEMELATYNSRTGDYDITPLKEGDLDPAVLTKIKKKT